MLIEERLLRLLKDAKYDGILQSEIVKALGVSKSRVSEILSYLEKKGVIVRKIEIGKSYRVWLSRYYPFGELIRVGILKSTEYAAIISSVSYDVLIYDNAIDLTRDLVLEKVDVAASPLVTQVMFGIMMKNLKIFNVIAENGSGVVFGDKKNGIFGTTEMSAMEMNLKAVRDRLDVRCFRYFASPEKMIANLKGVEGIAIWEPFISMIKRDKIYFDEIIGNYPCCTIAANKNALKSKKEQVEEVVRDVQKGKIDVKRTSEILAFDKEIVENSVKSYNFNPDYSVNEILSYLRRGGIEISKESLINIFEYL